VKFQETALRYAKALLQIAQEKEHIDSVVQQIEMVTKQIQSQEDVAYFLTAPVVKAQNQKEALLRFFENLPLREEVQNLLFLLVQKRRFFLLPAISRALQTEVDAIHGVQRGNVRSAKTLSAGEQKSVESAIADYTKKKIQLEYKEDPTLIGGIVAQVGSYTFDDSLETQIRLLNEDLLKKEYLLNGNQS
jgi:F-type H+-transporting ATPase subunit delta